MTKVEIFQLQVPDKGDKTSVGLRKIGTVTSDTEELEDPEIIWDLCNYSCWGWNESGKECDIADSVETETKRAPKKAVTRGPFKYEFSEFTPGYCNDDICFLLGPSYYVACSFGWETVDTLEDAEKYLKTNSFAYAGRFFREKFDRLKRYQNPYICSKI